MLYLASQSPRRAELLAQIGVKFERLNVQIDESALAQESAQQQVVRLCREKAREGRRQLDSMQLQDLVLAADTLIEVQGQVLGKPQSEANCRAMLSALSGRVHQVYTAVALINAEGQINHQLSCNDLRFRELEPAEIAQYCGCEEPVDKAGAYAIQGKAAVFIQQMDGNYSSVMGLPLYETAQLLQQAGYQLTF